jgi:tRNA threonylcarbamoyladenosine biosynthesis protein TsaE
VSAAGQLILPDAAATERLGRALGQSLAHWPSRGLTVWLEGSLGAGKTTLVRGLLRGLGHSGRVPSPTYTLLEPYDLKGGRVWHADLYRLQTAAEADFLGLSELPGANELLLIEWPERGRGAIAEPDLRVDLALAGPGRLARIHWQGALPDSVRSALEKLPLQPAG